MEQKLYRFSELPEEIQADIIHGKLRDTVRQGLLYNLALDMVEGQNSLLEQAENELYTIDGTYMDEL